MQCLHDVLTVVVQRCGVCHLVEQGQRSPVHVQDLQRRGQHDDAGTGRFFYLIHGGGSFVKLRCPTTKETRWCGTR
jgi:hypothetical protein